MMCYRDRTYCGSDCINNKCDRFISQEVEDSSLAWTKTFKPDATEGLLAISDLSVDCEYYIKPEGDTNE